ncbi:MAG: SIMPL domain-containing protein [Candidatus Pacebacteria bacterium]|jgi:hypothetical protein|nr:SIMPL domain-containing protein [Candidatus Paceibacterota bacterium]
MEQFFGGKKFAKSLIILASVISVFFVVKIVSTIREYKYIGQDVLSNRTITVEGKGEEFAIPDIATISFGAQQDGATVVEAQKEVTRKIDAALAVITAANIAEKDIKTVEYSAVPRYEIQPPCLNYFCPSRDQKIIGYTVNQTISVKVRDTEKVSALLDGLAKAEVTNISGPDFSVDDEDAMRAKARAKAIDDAKAKATVLSKQLGVKLVRIANFSESGNYPIYYAKSAVGMGASMEVATAMPTPALPVGENKITSNVTITYEIR